MNFLEIVGILKKLQQKTWNHWNFFEGSKFFFDISKKNSEIKENFLEIGKISNMSLRKKRNPWIFFANVENFLEIDPKIKVVVKISGSSIQKFGHHWDNTIIYKKKENY